MTIHSPDQPFFLPPRTGENNGVDFLGLRQTNLDMMADMIPSINNVTDYIRPFSLVCWVFWKFYDLCSAAGLEDPSREDIDRFRERIEVLFSWGASMHQNGGRIPGTGAVPPAATPEGQYPLTFKDWKRIQSSTSLIAALWYGPASKIVTGLGFLMPLPGKTGFFRVTGLGIRLAEALDVHLRSNEELYSRLLATLAPVTASREDAVALWQIWAPDQILEAERVAFHAALFSEEEIGDRSGLLGKRSTTLALAIHHMRHCTSPADVAEIRQGMALSIGQNGTPYTCPEKLIPTRNSWLTLQMRQLQRLSMECLLSWCEDRILADRINETSAMAARFSEGWDGADNGFDDLTTVDDMIALLDGQANSIEGFIAAINEERLENPFDLMATIQQLFRARDPSFAHYAFLGMLLCVGYSGAAASATQSLQLGGAPRLSLDNVRRRMVGLGAVSVREAFQYILEAMIISQHFSTAVNRFDGRNQRLRLTIEETGLAALVRKPWEPSVTEDRLPTLLSLAAQSGIVARNEQNAFWLE
mgnify:CR=1 FL=1